jgi:hypothetical protein
MRCNAACCIRGARSASGALHPAPCPVHTKCVWIHGVRINKLFTLKTRQLRQRGLQESVDAYNATNRHKRKELERFKHFDDTSLIARQGEPRHLLAERRRPR